MGVVWFGGSDGDVRWGGGEGSSSCSVVQVRGLLQV